MAHYEDKPEARDIQAAKEHLLKIWQSAHAQWEKVDQFYHRTYPLWPAHINTREEYRPSTPTNVVDHAVDTQLAFSPRIHRFPAGRGETQEERADLIEPWAQAAMEEMALLEPMLTWKQLGKHETMYGYGHVEGPLLDNTERPSRPRRQRGEDQEDFEARETLYANEKKTWFPFRTRALHPARVLLDPMQKKSSIAIKMDKRYSYQVYELTMRKMGKRSNVGEWKISDPYDTVDMIEYWTRYWHGVMASGQLLYVEKNTWGYVPYKHAFAGFGQEPTSMEEIDPKYLAIGILDPIMESIKNQAQSHTGRHNALMTATFNKRGTTQPAEEMAEQLANSDIIEGQPGALWWLDTPNLPNWIFQEEQWVDRDIEQGSFARVLGGFKEPGVSTVGQQAILSTAASKKFAALTRQLEHIATNVGSDLLRLVDVLGERITVRGRTIGPSEIQHDYSIVVTFELIDPVLQLQQRELGMREVQMELKSDETYRNADAKLEDEMGERKRLDKMRMRRSPEYQALKMAALMEELGLTQSEPQPFEGGANGNVPGANGNVPGANGNVPGAGPLLGPDGLPIQEGLGNAADLNSPAGPGRAMRELRQAIAPGVQNPPRTGTYNA